MYHVGINHIIQIQFFPQASVCFPKKEGKKVKIKKKKLWPIFPSSISYRIRIVSHSPKISLHQGFVPYDIYP